MIERSGCCFEAEELLKEVPWIFWAVIRNYDISGVELKAYLSDETSYIRIKEDFVQRF